ncbi:competence/damage-inducible protein A [Bryobacter aggregatus]|uniref:competence/damage-inducible protein A n=1 Tax=Bryobacter aggregatus TaxID=360054 RepID=UPI0004E15CB0|nr:competence/damage-inducible protein A [Bryobacter aggregatus]
MHAAIIAVGSELLTHTRLDTNSLYLTEKLNDMGVEVVQKLIVGDHRGGLEKAVRYALESAQLLILTGGLGPTEDDLTREAVAAATDRAIHFDPEVCAWLEARFQSFGRTMSEINKRQAYVLEGAEVLPNGRGTAPGQWLSLPHNQIVVLLPGPPGEMKPMAGQEFFPRLQKILPPLALATATFRVSGIGESDLDALIAPIYKPYERPVTTILAKAGDITVHLRTQATTQTEADALTSELAAKIEAALGNKIYSHDGSPLEAAVLRLLEAKGQTVAVAESLTGGMLGSRLSGIAGASKVFVGGFISYNNGQKQSLLGVDPWAIAEHTEVSEEVALQMAVGAQERANAHWALSLTGYAGPDGGTAENPVGTVFCGIAGPGGFRKAHRFRYPTGDRDRIRQFAVQSALNLLRLTLI